MYYQRKLHDAFAGKSVAARARRAAFDVVAEADVEIARLQAQAQEDVQRRVDLAAALDSKDAEIRHLRATVLSVAEHRDQLFADKTRLQAQVDALAGALKAVQKRTRDGGSYLMGRDVDVIAATALAAAGR